MENKTLTVATIARLVGGKVIGDDSLVIQRVAPLDIANKLDISFLSNPKLIKQLDTTQAGCVLLSEASQNKIAATQIICSDPYLAFAKVAQALDSTPLPASEISSDANIHSSVILGKNVKIAPGAVVGKDCVISANVCIGANTSIGEGSTIGESSILYSNVSIYHGVSIGNECIIHSGVVIGSDGFGYANESGSWVKIPQTGGVEIHDYVEIGANTTIDRGALQNTVIGKGVKIDNLCHIAHNVSVGSETAMAAFTGIAGSSNIGERCLLSGRSSIVGHLDIAPGTQLTAGTMVTKSNDNPAIFSSGTGAQENNVWRRNVARFKQLDEMARKIKFLEKTLKELNNRDE